MNEFTSPLSALGGAGIGWFTPYVSFLKQPLTRLPGGNPGEAAAHVIDIVTQLVIEAVGKIVPIMSQAMARAAATFGQSIVEAIPVCVQIAVEHGQKILAELAVLLSSTGTRDMAVREESAAQPITLIPATIGPDQAPPARRC